MLVSRRIFVKQETLRYHLLHQLLQLFFLVQIAVYSFHEFCEAGIFPNSEAWHVATEPYSPDGYYGKWFSLLLVAGSMGWLFIAWLADKFRQAKTA